MKAILYSRVSKIDDSRTTENQRIALQDWAASHPQAAIVAEITEQASSADTRPGKERALKMIYSRLADTIVVWKLDRWSRSTAEFALEIEQAIQNNWAIVSLTQPVDLTTSSGRAMARMLLVFAELERDFIRERTILGKRRAALEGKHDGRPSRIMRELGWKPGLPCAPYGCKKHTAVAA